MQFNRSLIRLFISLIFIIFKISPSLAQDCAEYIKNSTRSQKILSKRSRKDIVDFITHQFDPYRKTGVQLSQLEALQKLTKSEKKQIGFTRFQIIDGQIYAEHNTAFNFPGSSLPMFNVLTSSLQRILKTHKINNVDFVFFAVDNLYPSDKVRDLIIDSPTFMMSNDFSRLPEKGRLLIPDAYILNEQFWPPLIKDIMEGSLIYPWETKDSKKIFWRGATTGGSYDLQNYHHLPRLTLVMMSRSFPELIDARFMHYDQFREDQSGKDLRMVLDKLFINPGHLKEKAHLKYKYLISLDGNTAAWIRVPWILLSNSVLIKQETEVMEIFYSGMKPYVHYVPVTHNISDIFEKLNWLKNNDKKAKQISENATHFICSNLMPTDIDEYLAIILNEYHKLQRFNVITPTLPIIK